MIIRRLSVSVLLACVLVGCAAQPKPVTSDDPLEGFNRAMFAVNDTADRWVVKPVAKAYDATVPAPVQTGVRNFFDNITYPTVIVNNFLQGKFKDAGSGVLRFLFNTTFGVVGIFDPATAAGLPKHDEDFGQTLAVWGVGSGPYLMLPVFGPGSVRSAFSRPVDSATSPLTYYVRNNNNAFPIVIDLVQLRADLLEQEDVLEDAYDKYLFFRDAYIQRRNYLIFDGDPPLADPDDFDEDLDYDIEVDL